MLVLKHGGRGASFVVDGDRPTSAAPGSGAGRRRHRGRGRAGGRLPRRRVLTSRCGPPPRAWPSAGPSRRTRARVNGPLAFRGVEIPAGELAWRFSRSSGPGGQSVNTADSRVELSYDVATVHGAPRGVARAAAVPALAPPRRRRADDRRVGVPLAAPQPRGGPRPADGRAHRGERSPAPAASRDASDPRLEGTSARGQEEAWPDQGAAAASGGLTGPQTSRSATTPAWSEGQSRGSVVVRSSSRSPTTCADSTSASRTHT